MSIRPKENAWHQAAVLGDDHQKLEEILHI